MALSVWYNPFLSTLLVVAELDVVDVRCRATAIPIGMLLLLEVVDNLILGRLLCILGKSMGPGSSTMDECCSSILLSGDVTVSVLVSTVVVVLRNTGELCCGCCVLCRLTILEKG
jgi:hypothetical protein